MAKSGLFQVLESRLSNLDGALLPPISPTGEYTDAEIERVVAYRILAHAAFETFVEERLCELARAKRQEWQTTGIAGEVICAVLAFYDEKWPKALEKVINVAPGDLAKPQWLLGHVHDRVERAVDSYCARLKQGNNGIKERNLTKMLVAVGYPVKTLDAAWVGSLNSFGSSRGFVAHNANRIQQAADPASERSQVRAVLGGFEQIDADLQLLR